MTRVIVGHYDEAGNLVFDEIEPVPTAEQDAHEWWENDYERWLVDNLLAVEPYEPPKPEPKAKRKRARR